MTSAAQIHGLDERPGAYAYAAAKYQAEHPEQRLGQAHFNVLRTFDPEFADEITGTELDPFYDDGNLGPMLDALGRRWSRV
jgi:hypothetical protein